MANAERNDAFNLRLAIDEAKRRAARSGAEIRIYRAYNAYCMRPSAAPYEGVSVGFCTATTYRAATGTE